MSDANSHQELPSKYAYIIPAEYYDCYRLVFTHYHLDRRLVRIGMNERQRKITERRRTVAISGRSIGTGLLIDFKNSSQSAVKSLKVNIAQWKHRIYQSFINFILKLALNK